MRKRGAGQRLTDSAAVFGAARVELPQIRPADHEVDAWAVRDGRRWLAPDQLDRRILQRLPLSRSRQPLPVDEQLRLRRRAAADVLPPLLAGERVLVHHADAVHR
jgi:hypothetical protein